MALFFITLFGGFIFKELELERELRDARHARVAPFDTFRELRKSHFLRAIGVVSSSAMAATSRVVKRARQLSVALVRRRVVQFQRDSPMRFFFLLS